LPRTRLRSSFGRSGSVDPALVLAVDLVLAFVFALDLVFALDFALDLVRICCGVILSAAKDPYAGQISRAAAEAPRAGAHTGECAMTALLSALFPTSDIPSQPNIC
jgi:hypothetical protein